MTDRDVKTFTDWQQFAREISDRGRRLSDQIRDRARAVAVERMNCSADMAFLGAHNWRGQKWMTPEQNQAAREILHLEQLSWKPGELAERIINRAWKRITASRGFAA